MKAPALLVPLLLLAGAAPVDQKQMQQIVQPYIEQQYIQGLVVGVVDSTGSHVFGFGQVGDSDARAPDGNTVFEIGSVTKVFTSLLLADMVERKQVQLDDPIQKYLPDSVHLDQKGDRPNTLLDLATHRSGLPRLPTNMETGDLSNPYAGYTPDMLLKFLSNWRQDITPGSTAEYSNLGAGLLGYLLSRHATMTYEQLLNERITGPLKMTDTSLALNESQQRRLAQPHNADGDPVHTWEFTDALAGAGAIRSTASDMLRFLQAQIDPPDDELGRAIMQTQVRRNKFAEHVDIGLGWLISDRGYLWHNGETGGFHSFVAFDPKRKVGIAALSNNNGAACEIVAAQVFMQMTGIDLGPLPILRTPIKLNATQLDRFTGSYFLLASPLAIRRDGDRLLAQMTGQPEFRIFPESETSCFWKVVDAQVDFTFGDQPGAKAVRLVLHQNGRNVYGIRLPTTGPSTNPTISP